MFTKRIIPCLDVKNGRVVKGVNFVDLKDAGDPVEIAKAYDKAGADELVFLDITASSDDRSTVVDMVRKVAECVFIPFTVGGGIRTVDDFKALLREGADKISINLLRSIDGTDPGKQLRSLEASAWLSRLMRKEGQTAAVGIFIKMADALIWGLMRSSGRRK